MNKIKLEDILSNVLKNKYSAFFYTPPLYDNAVSYYFENPQHTISAKTIKEIDDSLKYFDDKKLSAYSLINYEAGYALERSLNKYFKEEENKILINVFDKSSVEKYNSQNIIIPDTGYSDYSIKDFRLHVTELGYKSNIQKIKKYLIDGDTYQVNYTTKSSFDFFGDYISFFKSLLFNQSAKYSAFINLGDKILISISPELFFEINGNNITTLPMKGTINRGNNLKYDAEYLTELSKSEKDKAENVMIVDLLRNDIGKICEFGSVNAPNLFSVEKYESLFQMVSKVTGKLKDEISIGDVIRNIFPCGSVTGAPKIRTMEIINELEKEKRGIYTGAIGIIENEKATFSVAIRTLEINKKTGKGEMGLGSGIVIDSDPDKEFEEVKLKGRFLSQPEEYFELFETMIINNGRIKYWDEHINRLKKAAEYFLFCIDGNEINKIKKEIMSNVQYERQYRLKLLLNKNGKIKFEISEYIPYKGTVKIILSNKKISSKSKYQYFKTTNRKLYNDEYIKWNDKGFFDVIFFNEKNELTEGSISNIFVKIDGFWLTPKIECGILNGIKRGKILEQNMDINETIISFEILKKAESIVLVNSLRGITCVDELHLNKECVISLTGNK